MLFSRVFNWIKYKTLPPSTLFLNRLFVERDSKHRRLTSNLGLTFRNSKWSMYARTNINDVNYYSLYSYYANLVLVLSLLATVYSGFYYYDTNGFFDYVKMQLWFMFDLEVYVTTMYTMISWLMINKSIYALYMRVLHIDNNSVSHIDTSTFVINLNAKSIPKRLYKSILYKWSNNITYNPYLSSIFSTQQWRQYSVCQKFYYHLYKLVKTVIKIDQTLNLYKSVVNTCSKRHGYVNHYLSYSKAVIHSHALTSSCTLSTDYTLRLLRPTRNEQCLEFSYWTLDSIASEWLPNSHKIVNKSFYLKQLTYNKLNQFTAVYPELRLLTRNLESHVSLRSVHKWLYRYNILHRTSLRDSTQTIFTLQHLAPSFYTSTFFSRNMWTSSILSKTTPSSLNVGSYQEALYANNSLYSIDNSLQLSSQFQNINDLSQTTLLPLSYNWFIQRFYQFNTLSTHNVQWYLSKTTRDFNRSSFALAHNAGMMTQFIWYLNKHNTHYISVIDPKAASYFTLDDFSSCKSRKSIYLGYTEYSLFTKLNTEIGLNLVTNQGAPSLVFYNIQPLAIM